MLVFVLAVGFVVLNLFFTNKIREPQSFLPVMTTEPFHPNQKFVVTSQPKIISKRWKSVTVQRPNVINGRLFTALVAYSRDISILQEVRLLRIRYGNQLSFKKNPWLIVE